MKVKVTEENVVITECSCINEGEVGINECSFLLTECFEGLTVTAAFNNIPVIVTDNKCNVPSLKKGTAILGVYAYKENNEGIELMYSPKPTSFFVNQGSFSDECGVESVPSISEFEQLCRRYRDEVVEKLENIEVDFDKVTTISEASTDEEIPSAKAVFDLFSTVETPGDDTGKCDCVGFEGTFTVTPEYKPFTRIINDCQNTADWNTNNLSNCEADTENYILGKQSIHSTNGAMVCLMNPFDMINNNLVLKLRINSMDIGARLQMQVLNTSAASKNVVYNLMRGATTTPVGEWREITVPYTGYSYGAYNEADFSNLNYIRIYAEGGSVDWNLQYVGTRPVVLDKGIVTFAFDDGYKSQYNGLKILAEKGVTGTVFYIPEANTNGSDDYMKVADLQNLVNYYGTDVEVHGLSSYNDKTNEELIAHWDAVQKLLKENGLGEGKYMAYPNNMHEDRVVQLAKSYFKGCRTIQYYIPGETYPPGDNYRVRAISSISAGSNNVEYIKDKIDRAMASKSWLVLVFHRIENGNDSMCCSENDFTEIADYAISSGAYIMNYAEVMESSVVNTNLGNISKALDGIIDIQNSLLGGAGE